MAFRAKREYLLSFRRSIEQGVVKADDVRLSGSELSTVETLVQELAHPEPSRVIYAIDVLESLDKRNLVTPLLLYHEAPKVRARALAALGAVRSDIARQWTPQIRRMLGDPESSVRAAAIGALVAISEEDAASLSRPLLKDPDAANSRHGGGRAGRQPAGPPMSMPRRPPWSSSRAIPRGRSTVAARRRHRGSPDRRPAVPAAADSAALRSFSRRRRRGDGERRCGRHRRLRVRPDPGRAAARSPAEGARARGARRLRSSRSSTRSPTSCATRTRTCGCAATFRRRWR